MNVEYSPRISGHRLSLAADGLVGALAIGLVIAAVAACGPRRNTAAAARPEPVRATWSLPQDLSLGAGPDLPFGLTLAPDGRHLVFPASREGQVMLWLQDLRSGATSPLPGTEDGALPFWSPDASRIGFVAGSSLRAFDSATAAVTDVMAVSAPRGASWNARGDLVVSTADDGGLTLRAADGATRPLTTPNRERGEEAHLLPMFLPDGEHVAYYVRAESPARGGVWMTSIAADAVPTRLAGSAAQGIPAGDGLLLSVDGALVAQRVDLVASRLDGPTMLLGTRVGHGPLGQLMATASDDVVIFGPPASTLRQLVWMSREGERLGTLGGPADAWRVRIAADGRRVLATLRDPLLNTLDVVQFDGSSLVPSRVSLSIDADDSPVWSPDGRRVAWVTAGRTVTIRGAGAVLPADIVRRFDEPVQVTDWAPDGGSLVITRRMPGTREDVWMVPIGGGDPRPLVETPFADVQGVMSPDGRWVAYASDESGRFDLYVERVRDRSPGPGTRERVTSGGGSDPRWSRDGRSLFFRRGSEIHVATPALGRGPDVAATTSMVFETQTDVRSFDVAPGGDRFLLNLPVDTAPEPATLLVHWPRPGPQVTQK